MDLVVIKRSWEAYINAWGDLTTKERRRLVDLCASEEIEYSNPVLVGKGRPGLIEAMEQFQEQYPGARFQPHWTTVQHNHLLSGWTLYDKDGSARLKGYNYARADEQGIFTHMAGFFET